MVKGSASPAEREPQINIHEQLVLFAATLFKAAQ
jgi:hypothetical protein